MLLYVVVVQCVSQSPFPKVTDDVDTKYTSVGRLGLTISNYGTLGTRNSKWPTQPSAEFPRGSFIEHIYYSGLWVGAVIKTNNPNDPRNNQIVVSTGATDRASSSSRAGEGYEFTNELGDSITELSSLSDDRPASSQYSPAAVSHQDFICDYSDKNTRVPSTGDSILNHTKMGIRVHQESYAWNYPFADFFVILKYTIFNASPDTLDSVYVGLWNNAVVRNTSRVGGVIPGTPGYFDHTGHGYDSLARMGYSFDFDGLPGQNPSRTYVGLKLLGTYPFPSDVDSLADLYTHTNFNAWRFRSSSGEQVYYSPSDDYNTEQYTSRYSRMANMMPKERLDAFRKSAQNGGIAPVSATYLLSTGPFSRLNPGDSVEVVFAVVCAQLNGQQHPSLDTRDQRKNLYANASWAQQAYNGEDANGNNILDDGEDIARRDSLGLRYEPDGRITRYLLPTPPRRPKVRSEVSDQSIVIYWDKISAEESIDPISGKKDFEGYRIYRSTTGSDFLQHEQFTSNLIIAGDFDRSDDSVGFNTGFSKILMSSPKVFADDTVKYWYRFPPESDHVQHLNGWQYIYGITAYDQGDTNVSSLESSKLLLRLVPGTPAVASNASQEIGVYPNPYYVNAAWDGARERLRKIYFFNLPGRCIIRVYTLAGDVVTEIDHDAESYNGSGIEWFNEYGDKTTTAQFAGGEHAWDLITRNDQAIATGLYLFTVEDKANGDIKRGKFLIIK